MNTQRLRITALATLATAVLVATPATALDGGTATPTTFTYQGELVQAGTPLEGIVDLEFSLWNAAVGGSQIGSSSICNDVQVAGGRFTASVDLGSEAAGNSPRWIEIMVDGATLSPRQRITATPYALQTRGMTVFDNEDVDLVGTLFIDESVSFVGINRDDRVSAQEYFGVYAPTLNDFGGMYVQTQGEDGSPFYGYSRSGSIDAYHYYSPDTDAWNLYVNGERLNVGADGDVGIGVNSPTTRLDVATQAGPAFRATSQNASLFVGDDFVGVNRESAISASEHFGVGSAATSGFAGMYVSTAGGGAWPFYGYSAGGDPDAYHYYDGTLDRWNLNVNGLKMTVRGDTGDVGFGVAAPAYPIHLASGARCTVGGTWVNASSETLKENFEVVDGGDVLAILDELPILAWNYKSEDDDVRHVGPTAEAFRSAFGLGDASDSIATVDADGVALAAIQGLHDMLETESGEVDRLTAENAELRDLVELLADRLDRLEAELR